MKEQDAGVKWFNTIFYPQKKTSRAVRYEEGVLPRLHQKEITLFTPWGPRYSWESRGSVIQEGDKEIEVLYYLAGLFRELRQNMPDKNFRWVILGADLYGARINNLPAEATADYFSSLSQWFGRIIPISEFWLWSRFDNDAEKYREEIRANFDIYVSGSLMSRAVQTARAMGRSSSAKEYLIERLAEAMLIESVLKPIKISCVAKYKDDCVDLDLPRLYLLSERLHAPWL